MWDVCGDYGQEESMTVIQPRDIILETALLKTMSDRQNFTSYVNSVDHNRVLPATKLLLKDYKRYFKLYPEHESVDFGQFQTQFTQNWHNKDLDQLDIEYYRDYVFPAIAKAHGSDLEHCLLGLMHKQTAEELSEVANTKFDITVLRDILTKYEEKEQLIFLENDKDAITADNVDLEVLDKNQGIPFFLPTLQQELGGIIQGQFVVVSADSNTGKSAFVISQAVHAFQHGLAGPILYFNSEGTPGDIYARFWSNLYRDSIIAGTEEIVRQRNDVREQFKQSYDTNKLVVFQIYGKNIAYIRSKLKKYKPSLVIIDMLDTLADVEDPITLKKLYDNIRGLSLEYCAIIGTTQSGNTEYFNKDTGKFVTKRFLTDKDVLGCKAKSASAETMLAIGKDANNPLLRFITTPKTKRGEPTTVTCQIERKYSLYKEITF